MLRIVALVSGLAVLAACGSSEKGKSSQAPAPTAAQPKPAPAASPAKPPPAPKPAAPSKPAEMAFVETADGVIALEAESFHANTPKEQLKWARVLQPAGFSGAAAMEAQPNEDVNNNEDFVTLSPRLDFKVKFTKTGSYRVWVRGWGKGESDNSCHVGLNGQAVETSDRIGEFPADEWAWLNDTHDGEPAALEVKTAGVHTINVWMREDGFIIDKILLAKDASYAPSGAGPAEAKQ